MTAIGAGGQEAPLWCRRCVADNDREVVAELEADMAADPTPRCMGRRGASFGCVVC